MTPIAKARYVALLILCLAVLSRPAEGQGYAPAPTYAPPAPTTAAPGFPMSTTPSASLGPGIQPFDPYAITPGTPSQPALPGTFGSPTLPPAPGTSWPAAGLTNPTTPYPAPPPYTPPAATPFGANPYAAPTAAPYGATPFTGAAQPVAPPPYERLIGNTGFRFTWVIGDGNGDQMGETDLELSTTFNCANFFGSLGGLKVTPGFVFTWLDGPSPPVQAEMPPRLYSAYVDFGWDPVFTPTLRGELHFRPGVFSDFDAVNTNSIRLITSGVGIIQLSPTSSLKLGVMYIDRADVKLLPAFGLLCTPDARSRYDIFFPSPKISHYWKTVYNGQIWWYLGGEYGGGSWTMTRPGPPDQGAQDRVDINDIRVFAGFEWYNLNRNYGFFEFGYVFERQLFFVVVPDERTSLKDTVMLRAGLAF